MNRLRELRKQHGLTQAKLLQMAHIKLIFARENRQTLILMLPDSSIQSYYAAFRSSMVLTYSLFLGTVCMALRRIIA